MGKILIFLVILSVVCSIIWININWGEKTEGYSIILVDEGGINRPILLYKEQLYIPLEITANMLGNLVAIDVIDEVFEIDLRSKGKGHYLGGKVRGYQLDESNDIIKIEDDIKIETMGLRIDGEYAEICAITFDSLLYTSIDTINDLMGVEITLFKSSQIEVGVGLNDVDESTQSRHGLVYDSISEAIRKGEDKLEISKAGKHRVDIQGVYNQLFEYNPYVGYIKHMSSREGKTLSVSLDYKVSKNQIPLEIFEVEQSIDTFIKNNIFDSDSIIDMINKAHSYVIENTKYLSETINKEIYYAHVPYGMISTGQMVCSGYANTLQLILNKLRIENVVVIGEGKIQDVVEEHAWNMVLLDGRWYHIDPTWNDGSLDLEGLGASSKLESLLSKEYSLRYFLVGDDKLRQTHRWDRDRYPKTENIGVNLYDSILKHQLDELSDYNLLENTKDLEKLVRDAVLSNESNLVLMALGMGEITHELTDIIQSNPVGGLLASCQVNKLDISDRLTVYNLIFYRRGQV